MSRTFKDMDGYVLAVHLDCKSVTRKLEYELKATVREKPFATSSVTSR